MKRICVSVVLAASCAMLVALYQGAGAQMPQPDAKVMKQALTKYFDAVNHGDASGVSEAFAENATIEDPVGSPVKSGKEALDFIKRIGSSGIKYELVQPLRGNVNGIAADLKVRTPQGSVNAIEIYTFDKSNRISSMRAYWGPDDRGAAR